MNAPIPCSDDVVGNPVAMSGYQTGREYTPQAVQDVEMENVEMDAERFVPRPQPQPQASYAAAASPPNAGGDGDTILIQGGGGTIQARNLASNLKPGVMLQIGVNNSMTVVKNKDGTRTYTGGDTSGISSGLQTTWIPNSLPLTACQDEPTERHLTTLQCQISKEWRRLGRALKLTDPMLDQVHHDFSNQGLQEVVHQMLMKWIRTFYPATQQLLAMALVDIGRGDLADKMRA